VAYKLVHVNTMPDFLAFAAMPSRFRGYRTILDIHDAMPELFAEKFGRPDHPLVVVLRIIERLSASISDHVLAVHELHRRRLVQNGIPSAKITTVINAPDPAIFQPSPRTPAPGRFRFAYHGTIAHRHGLDLAVRALAQARHARPELSLRVIGDGDEVPALRSLIQEVGVTGAVEFHQGFVPVDAVPSHLRDVDAGVVPQRRGPAMDISLPTKLLEYAALGIPAIAARTSATDHYFGSGGALLFEPEDVDDLAMKMITMHDDAALRARVEVASAQVVRQHSWTDQRLVYLQLVAKLLPRAG
jgi:glycosyltransferase involved in cell wall biosynthesis